MKTLRTGVSIVALGVGAVGWVSSASASAIISNGTIEMGVNDLGDLNVPFDGDPLGIGYMGLRYIPTGAASTEPGCTCEGWGVALVSSGQAGYANTSVGTGGLTQVSFTSSATSATSVVNVDTGSGAILQVTHDYHPIAATSNLYAVDVTIQNLSGSAIAAGDLVYRRVMDWDIYPTPFAEDVTIQGVPSTLGFVASGGTTNVLQTDNNGFNSSNPLSFTSYGQHNVNFTDVGPADHGALFDFDFGALAAGASLSFTTYYGATGTEADADAVRALVGMNLYSYGQPSTPDGPTLGEPNTFIFGFGTSSTGVLTPPPTTAPVPEPETYAMLLAGIGILGAVARRKKQHTA